MKPLILTGDQSGSVYIYKPEKINLVTEAENFTEVHIDGVGICYVKESAEEINKAIQKL